MGRSPTMLLSSSKQNRKLSQICKAETHHTPAVIWCPMEKGKYSKRRLLQEGNGCCRALTPPVTPGRWVGACLSKSSCVCGSSLLQPCATALLCCLRENPTRDESLGAAPRAPAPGQPQLHLRCGELRAPSSFSWVGMSARQRIRNNF